MAESIQIFMEKDRLQPLADNIKVLKGADNITLQQMEDTIAETNTDIVSQTDLIAQLASALQGKAAGGGGASVETCTVVLDGDSSAFRPYYYSYTTIDANGNITGAAVEANSATDVTLNNVVCGSVVTIYWYTEGGLNQPTNATQIASTEKYFHAYKITAPAGGTATIRNDPQSSGGGIL